MSKAMPPEFSVSDTAEKRLILILSKKPVETFLRIAVNGGGCSGFQYAFTFEQTLNGDDLVFDSDGGVRVVIDEISLPLLKGGQLDYVQELIGASFQITNPNAKASCGCGTSFTLAPQKQ